MRFLLSALIAAGPLAVAPAAFAQSGTTPPASPPAVQSNAAPATPVAPSKRFACQTAAQALKGQDRQDRMQLCMAQARLDCLKQAIDQKIVGPQRKEFVQSCVTQ